eukprot:725687-Prorocentrum_minimum.AAC.2
MLPQILYGRPVLGREPSVKPLLSRCTTADFNALPNLSASGGGEAPTAGAEFQRGRVKGRHSIKRTRALGRGGETPLGFSEPCVLPNRPKRG